MPNPLKSLLESAISRALNDALACAYDMDGPTHADIAATLVSVTIRWAGKVLGAEQILAAVQKTLAEPSPTLVITQIDIPGRDSLPGWCRGVVERQD